MGGILKLGANFINITGDFPKSNGNGMDKVFTVKIICLYPLLEDVQQLLLP